MYHQQISVWSFAEVQLHSANKILSFSNWVPETVCPFLLGNSGINITCKRTWTLMTMLPIESNVPLHAEKCLQHLPPTSSNLCYYYCPCRTKHFCYLLLFCYILVTLKLPFTFTISNLHLKVDVYVLFFPQEKHRKIHYYTGTTPSTPS